MTGVREHASVLVETQPSFHLEHKPKLPLKCCRVTSRGQKVVLHSSEHLVNCKSKFNLVGLAIK